MVLDSKKIEYEVKDISSSEEDKAKMREICGDPRALPPQIVNGDQHCGVGVFCSLHSYRIFYAICWRHLLSSQFLAK